MALLTPILKTLLIAAIPLLELRVAIPYGIHLGLDPVLAAATGIIGNLVQVPLIVGLLFKLRSVSENRPTLARFFARVDAGAKRRSEAVIKYGWLGLALMVAIPIPGTGVWMGALIGQLLAMPMGLLLWGLSIGVILSGIIIGLAATGVIHLLVSFVG